MHLILARYCRSHMATLGILILEGNRDFALHTLEDEWKNNQPSVSCIPEGEYRCVAHGWQADTKLKFKRVWRLEGVAGRSGILIHAGNSIRETTGCILAGTGTSFGENEARLLNSQDGLERLRRLVWDKPFTLTIRGAAATPDQGWPVVQ